MEKIYWANFNRDIRKYEYKLKNGDTIFIAPWDMNKVNIEHESVGGDKYAPVFDEPWCEEDDQRMIIGFNKM